MNIDDLIEKARLTDEEIFNLGFETPYKSMSVELSVYTQGIKDGAQAQLDKILSADKILSLIKEKYKGYVKLAENQEAELIVRIIEVYLTAFRRDERKARATQIYNALFTVYLRKVTEER